MSIRERRPGVWEVRVYTGRDPVTGRPRQVSRTVHGGRKAAKAAEADLAAQAAARRTPPTLAPTSYVVEHVIDHLEHNRGLERSTIHGYRKIAAQLATDPIWEARWSKLRTRDLDDYYARMTARGASAAAVAKHHALLHAVGNWARRWEWATVNPVDLAVKPAKHAKRVEPLSRESVARLLAHADAYTPEIGVAFRLGALLGCRRGELCGLRWSDISQDAVTISRSVDDSGDRDLLVKDTKTHQARTVEIDEAVRALLVKHRTAMHDRAVRGGLKGLPLDGYVFSDELDGSGPWRPSRLTRAFTRVRERAGVSGRLHDLRHWHASVLLDAGEDVTVVAARLGHADPSTTHRVYAHMMPGAGTRAAGIVSEALNGGERP